MGRGVLVYLVIALLIAAPLLVPAPTTTLALTGMDVPDDVKAKLEDAMQKASPETQECIKCHLKETPGIVFDWLGSQHAWSKPEDVLTLYSRLGFESQIDPKFEGYQYTVGCYECHGMFKEQDRPDVAENHFGYKIVTIVTLKDCSQCHAKEAKEITWTMHGFSALNGPINPWYSKIVEWAKKNNRLDILPPVYDKTGKDIVDWPWYKQYAAKLMENPNDPEVQLFGTIYDKDFKDIVSPLYPASGILNATGLMQDPKWKNSYVYFSCMQCHGSLVVPYKNEGYRVRYWGWPSNGAGRIDPDGSLGACTACHTRHSFSVEEARKPHTCGQCHRGYDHPHIEIYEESKHGNIYDSEGESWNWSSIPWRVGVDFRAPTCATCHMSTLADAEGNILVVGSHDLRQRLVWDQMHIFSYPKPKWPDHTQNAIIKGGSQLTGKGLIENGVAVMGYKVRVEEAPASGEFGFPRLVEVKYTGELKQRRENMKDVCLLCHSSQWVDNFFNIYDQVIVEYNITAQYAYNLLQKAYEEGIHDPSNKLDEYMEIMWYYIWHHDGRRWRNGASMLGPDYTHWYGIVDTVMDKLGRMISYYNTAIQLKQAKEELAALKAQGLEAGQKAQELRAKIQELEAKLASMEAEIPKLKQQIDDAQAKLETLEGSVNTVQASVDELKPMVEEAQSAAGRAGTALIVGALGLIVAVVAVGLTLARKSS